MYNKSAVTTLYFVSFIDLCAVGLIIPVLGNHVRSLGASHSLVGLVWTIYGALQLVFGPVVGSWSDVKGRKPVFVITLLISAICYLLLGFASSVYLVVLIRIVQGVFKHTQTLCKALLADIVPADDQPLVFGRYNSIATAGLVIGPLVGGHLAEFQNGFLYICCLTFILFLFNNGLIYLLPNIQQKLKTSAESVSVIQSFQTEVFRSVTDLRAVDWSVFWDIFLLKFLHSFALSIYFSNYGLTLEEKYGITGKHIGYTVSFQSLVGVIAGFLMQWISRTFYKNDIHHEQKFRHALLGMTLSFIGLHYAPTVSIFITLLIPLAASYTLLRIIGTEVLITRSSGNKQGALMGTSNSITSFARLSAPLSSGIVSDMWGQRSVMLFAFFPVAVATLLAYSLKRIRHVKTD